MCSGICRIIKAQAEARAQQAQQAQRAQRAQQVPEAIPEEEEETPEQLAHYARIEEWTLALLAADDEQEEQQQQETTSPVRSPLRGEAAVFVPATPSSPSSVASERWEWLSWAEAPIFVPSVSSPPSRAAEHTERLLRGEAPEFVPRAMQDARGALRVGGSALEAGDARVVCAEEIRSGPGWGAEHIEYAVREQCEISAEGSAVAGSLDWSSDEDTLVDSIGSGEEYSGFFSYSDWSQQPFTGNVAWYGDHLENEGSVDSGYAKHM